MSEKHMEERAKFERLCEVVSDVEGMCRELQTDDIVLASLICKLVRMKMVKDKCNKQMRDKFKEEHGHSQLWGYVKNNPEQYAKMLERNKAYKQRKRVGASVSQI